MPERALLLLIIMMIIIMITIITIIMTMLLIMTMVMIIRIKAFVEGWWLAQPPPPRVNRPVFTLVGKDRDPHLRIHQVPSLKNY